jgi:hypothetical protein
MCVRPLAEGEILMRITNPMKLTARRRNKQAMQKAKTTMKAARKKFAQTASEKATSDEATIV